MCYGVVIYSIKINFSAIKAGFEFGPSWPSPTVSSTLCCILVASLGADGSGQFAPLVLDFQADLANSWSVAGTGSVSISVTPQLHFTLDRGGWGRGRARVGGGWRTDPWPPACRGRPKLPPVPFPFDSLFPRKRT